MRTFLIKHAFSIGISAALLLSGWYAYQQAGGRNQPSPDLPGRPEQGMNVGLQAGYVPPDQMRDEAEPGKIAPSGQSSRADGPTRPAGFRPLTDEIMERNDRAHGPELMRLLREAQNPVSGEWSTWFGPMNIRAPAGGSLRASYNDGAGRMTGEMSGKTFNGYWYEKDNPAMTCKETKFGTRHWGRLTLTFNEAGDAFNGQWRYGEDGAERGVAGQRKQTLRVEMGASFKKRASELLNQPDLLKLPEKLAYAWDEAIEQWMDDYAPGGKRSYEQLPPDDPRLQYGRDPLGPKDPVIPVKPPPDKNMPDDPVSLQILQGIKESGDRLHEELKRRDEIKKREENAGRSAPAPKKDPGILYSADDPKHAPLLEDIRRNLIKHFGKHFPEYAANLGPRDFKGFVNRLARIIAEDGGNMNALGPIAKQKYERVIDETLDQVLGTGKQPPDR